MKKLLVTILATASIVACSKQGSYLVRVPPPEAAIQEKTDNPDALVFTPKVDILFIVDESGSMSSHQKNLATNINLFVSEIAKDGFLDFHIGVVTTSMDNGNRSGRLVGVPLYVERSTPNALAALESNLLVGIASSHATEKSFEPIEAALTPPLVDGYNNGFYRDDAHLAVVFITDAEDQSSAEVDYYVELLKVLKNGEDDKIIAYGVIIPTGVTNCARDNSTQTPVRIEDFLSRFNGLQFNLCDPDFGAKLAGLGADLSERVGAVIPLNQLPDERTIVVTYGTQIIPQDPIKGWQYVPSKAGIVLGPELVLDENQPDGTQLGIQFVPADTKAD